MGTLFGHMTCGANVVLTPSCGHGMTVESWLVLGIEAASSWCQLYIAEMNPLPPPPT